MRKCYDKNNNYTNYDRRFKWSNIYFSAYYVLEIEEKVVRRERSSGKESVGHPSLLEVPGHVLVGEDVHEKLPAFQQKSHSKVS